MAVVNLVKSKKSIPRSRDQAAVLFVQPTFSKRCFDVICLKRLKAKTPDFCWSLSQLGREVAVFPTTFFLTESLFYGATFPQNLLVTSSNMQAARPLTRDMFEPTAS